MEIYEKTMLEEMVNFLNKLGIPYRYYPEFKHLFAYKRDEYAKQLLGSGDFVYYIRMRPDKEGIWYIRECGVCGEISTNELECTIKKVLI